MISFRNFFESTIPVFHGSPEIIDKFDMKKQISGYYPGFYTTSEKGKAESFGKHIYQFDIDPEKFYSLDNSKAADELKEIARISGYRVGSGSGHGETLYLKDKGYFGIKRGNEYILFQMPSSSAFF